MSAGLSESLIWKESSIPPDSSSSETGKDTPPEAVHFTLGDGPDEASSNPSLGPPPTPATTTSTIPKPEIRQPLAEEKLGGMVRSFSQDVTLSEERPSLAGVATGNATTSAFLTKSSYSENSLESATAEKLGRLGTLKKSLRDLPTVMSLDEETLSTDSNSTTDNDELKRRRRKLHFPAFRKSKNKPS